MSDLTTNLLTQYYGLGKETSSKFLSIHKCIANAKRDEEKQVTEQTSLTNEENASEVESQIEDENRKLSVASESYPRSSRVLEDTEDAYDPNDNSDTFNIDFGPNIMYDFVENAQSFATNEQLLNIVSPSIKTTSGLEENDLKNTNESDPSLIFMEDVSAEDISDVSSVTLKKSQKSSKASTPLIPIYKKEPICNETFVDFSNTGLKQFPSEILTIFSQLKMVYMADNNLSELPGEVFDSLRHLIWLDLRNNRLSSLPATIESHPCLETLLLQGNMIEKLPLELCTLPKLKTLQMAQNPLTEPPKHIITSGFVAILNFLRNEWNNLHPERHVEVKKNKIEPKLSTILCYQSPRRHKKKNVTSKNTIKDKDASSGEKRKSYKPSNRCENKGANISMEHRLLWFSKAKELLNKQASVLQKTKDENVLKEWRRDKRSFCKAMEKAMRRNEADIPFGFDLDDYASIFKQKPKLEKLRPKKKGKQKFNPPEDINKKINELLVSLNQLQMKTMDEITPRTKQNLLENQVEKILQFQNEIQNLQKYNDVATVSLKK